MTTRFSKHEYEAYLDDYAGFCRNCQDIGRESDTEPDAEDYECEVCGEMCCYGIEEALLRGMITVEDDND